VQSAAAGAGAAASNGGGGGGAVGRIVVHGPMPTTGTFSPALIAW
jgi:hypothetical protein